MAKINGFSEKEIINLLRWGIEVAGDGGMSPWNDGEYEACVEYLNELESKLKARYTMECFNCGELFQYTDEDVELLEKTFASACNEEYKPSYIIFAMIYDELAN